MCQSALPPLFVRARSLLSAVLVLTGVAAHSQTSSTASTDSGSENTNDGTVILSPFRVDESRDNGYQASNSVSATRTNVALKDMPLSMQVFTKDFIQDIGALELGDIIKYAPGVTAGTSEFTNGNTQYSIRGFYNTPLRDGFAAPTYVDASLIARVEVAKGPSTLLYGQLSPGGVVNYITKKPMIAERTEVRLRAGSYGADRLDFDNTGPLLRYGNEDAGLYYRLIAAYDQKMEYYDRAHRVTRVLTPQVEWRLNKNTSLLVEYSGYTGRENPPVMMLPNNWPNFGVLGTFWGPLPRTFNYASNQDFRNSNFNTLTADFNTKLPGDWDFRAVYDYMDRKVSQLATGVGWVTDGHTQSRRVRYEQQKGNTNELQAEVAKQLHFQLFDWKVLLGGQHRADWAHNTQQQLPANLQQPNWDLLNPATWTLDIPFKITDLTQITNNAKVDSTANGAYLVNNISAFKDRLKILGGLRYSEGENTITNYLAGGVVTGPFRATAWSPQIGAMWKIMPDFSFYSSYSKSFVPINGYKQVLPGQPLTPYSPMVGEGYDFGFKTDFLEGKVSSTFGFFRVVNTGIVRSVLSIDPSSGATGFVSVQSGQEASDGVEANVILSPTRNFQIYLSYSYVDAYVASNVQTPSLVGTRLENSARNLANTWFKYSIHNGSLKGLSFGGGVNYTSKKQQYVQTPSLFFPSTMLFDAFLGYSGKIGRFHYNISLAAKNLTDKIYYPTNQSRGDPRNYVLTTTFTF